MTEWPKRTDTGQWMCNRCETGLVIKKIRLQYMRVIFALDLPVCPHCNMILIGEELATGKMAEAEQVLEDK